MNLFSFSKFFTAIHRQFFCYTLLALPVIAYAQVSGTVFRDFNANGVKDNSATFNEVFEANVVVTIYNSANTAIASYKTNASGVFTIPATGTAYSGVLGSNTGFVAAATAVRIEFTGLGLGAYSAASGTGNNSSVQFATTPAASIVFGATYPEDYFGNTTAPNPFVIFPSYRNGLCAGNEDIGIAAILYNSTGLNSNYLNGSGVAGTGPIPKSNATVAEIGTTWGVAYNNTLKRSYHATFLKRHCGIADGLGYIYVMDQTKTYNALAGKFNLAGVVPTNSGAALNFGSVTRTGSADYTLSATKTSPNIDLDAFAKVGNVGYGDIDMQPGTNNLWAVNVFENSLISMDISGAPSTVPAIVNRYTLLGMTNYPTSTKGLLHPWALAFHKGYGYLGVTDDASITKVATDLKCYLLRFDPNNMAAGFTVILTFDPNTHASATNNERFQPWMSVYSESATYTANKAYISGGGNTHYHQPMFSDIEFDTDESLILSIMDREGHQFQSENYKPISGTTTLNLAVTYGSLLKACLISGTYYIEGSGGCGSASEFFADDAGDCDIEGVLGGTVLVPGLGQVLSSMKNPWTATCGIAYENSQGLMTFNTTSGAKTNWYTKNIGIALPYMGKAAGIGDVEGISPTPPIEIGNRVWNDANSDGIQDAGEAGIGGVVLDLYADFDNNGVPDVVAAASACANNTTATATLVATAGCTGTAWTTPANATTVNATATTAVLAAAATSQCLQVTGLGFAIPATATVTGVTVNIIRKASTLSTALDNIVQLVVGGVAVGANKAKVTTYPLTFSNSVYGNATDMWTTTLTPAQVNAANFGVNFRAACTASSTVSIDAIEVNVCYTTAAGTTFTATTTTASSGNIGTWYFNAANVPDGDPTTAGNQPGLAPNKKYIIRVASANIPSGKVLTAANVGGAGQPDARDSDASLVVSNAEIAYTTGAAGQNDHTLDMGFMIPPPTIALTLSAVGSCNCNSASGYMDVTGLTNLSGATFTTTGTYNNVPLPAYGTVDISYSYTGAGNGATPDFRNLDISQGFPISANYTALGFSGVGTVPGLRNKIAAGQTGVLTYSFDQPVKDVNLMAFDVDWNDAVTVTAWDAYGNAITDFTGWTANIGDLTNPIDALLPTWNPATHIISANAANVDGERNFVALRPNGYVSKVVFSFTGTTDVSTTPHTQYTIFSNLQVAQICNAAATLSVAFTNQPAGQTMTVTNGGFTQIIASGATSPQTVVLPYPPDGTGPHTITASFTGAAPATATINYTNISCYATIGNYVWTDANSDGLQAAEAGINGVIVELWKETAPASGTYALVRNTTTANNGVNDGAYLFNVTEAANYKVKFPTTSGAFVLTTQTATAATDGNSDAAATGFSPAFAMNPAGTGVAKDNLTIDAGFKPAVPTLATSVNISGCHDSNGNTAGGVSQVTVQVIVDWQNALNENITVSVPNGGAAQTFNPTTGAKPRILNFTVPTASATTGNVTANYVTTTSVAATPKPISIAASNCLLTPCANNGGIVFRDFNNNGTQDTPAGGGGGETEGISGVTVTAFWDNNSGATGTATTTTDAKGQYNIATGAGANQIPSGAKVRMEFSGLPIGVVPTANGTNNGTAVQFFTAPLCTINMGVNYPTDYCQTNPNLAASIFVGGNRSDVTGASNILLSFNYNNYSRVAYGSYTAPTPDATKSEIGSVWGLAYHKKSKQLFSAAFLKRHVDFGPNGLGAIYKTDYSTASTPTSLFIDLQAAPYNLNLGTFNTSVIARDLTTPGSPSRDVEAFGKIGKVGLGDIEISDDEQTMFAINLNEQKLIKINIGAGTPTAPSSVVQYALPVLTATNGLVRPFGLKYYKGKVYVGTVTTGENAGSSADISAAVYTFDPVSGLFDATPVISFPLDYKKGAANLSVAANNRCEYWLPWRDTHDEFTYDGNALCGPQAILSGLDFTEDGSMLLSFMDRGGHQWGLDNYTPDMTKPGGSYAYFMSGDLLKAVSNGNTWIVENNASFPTALNSSIGCGASNGEGPGGGEFFCRDNYGTGAQETSQGAVAYQKGKNEAFATVMDPLFVFTGGTSRFMNTTGNIPTNGQYELYSRYDYPDVNGGTFGKAGGMGDIELMCNTQPLEIGNYVWNDANSNGIQDPTEAGIANTKVQLFSRIGVLVGVATTNSIGQYYFNTSNVDTTGVNATGTTPVTGWSGLSYTTPYYIVVGNGGTNPFVGATLTVGAAVYNITGVNTGQGANPDQNDNDALIASGINASVNGFPYIRAVTGTVGTTDHTFDFGFKPAISTITTSVNTGTCYDSNGNTAGGTSQVTVSVMVTWTNPPSGQTIMVAVPNGGTQTIDPAVATQPTTLTFVVPTATATSGNVTANLNVSTSIAATPKAISIAASNCIQNPPCTAGILGGTVWIDTNNDGIKGAPETQGLAGVTVKAYNTANTLLATVTTDNLGQYAFTTVMPTVANPIRLEFSGLPAPYIFAEAGANSNSAIRFLSASDCSVNLSVFNPICTDAAYPTWLKRGYSAVSFLPGSDNVVFATKDIRKLGTLWNTNYNRNTDMSSSVPTLQTWTRAQFGGYKVFGITTDPRNGTIYVATSGIVADQQHTGGYIFDSIVPAQIYKISNTSTTPVLWATMTGSLGIGNIDIDTLHNQVFASSIDDGKIYRFNTTTAAQIGTAYDPLTPDDGTAMTPPPLGDAILGLGYNAVENKLYYSVWANNSLFNISYTYASTAHNTIRSVALDASGNILPATDALEATLPFITTPASANNFSSPVSDIEFTADGQKVLFAETGITTFLGPPATYTAGAHTNRVLEYQKSGGIWTLSATPGGNYNSKFDIGSEQYSALNSRGGAAWAYGSMAGSEILDNEGFMIATGDALHLLSYDGDFIYGYQFTPATGGSRFNSVLTNFGPATGGKYTYGDVEVFKGVGNGCAKGVEIGNYVWIDADRDGIQDAGETPLAGVEVQLLQGASLVAKTLTAVDGSYYFGGMTNQGFNFESTTPSSQTVTAAITSTANDARQNAVGVANGAAGLLFNNRYLGLRFPNINIPTGATIANATLRFTASGAGAINSVSIKAERNPDAAPYTIGNLPFTGSISDLYTNNATTAAVTWTNGNTWTVNASGADQTTPNLNSLIQEVIGLPTWERNKTLSFLINAPTNATGATAYDVSGDPTKGAVLSISFTGTAQTVGDSLHASTLYTINIPLAQTPLANYTLTTVDNDPSVGGDNRDSDGTISSGNAVKAVTTPGVGANHTYDFGFVCVPPTISITGSLTTCNSGTTLITASGGTVYAWSSGETTDAISKPAGTYTVTVTNSIGCSSTSSVLVVNTVSPTGVVATPTNVTCWSGAAQNNGKITLSGFGAGVRYQYSIGSTFVPASAIPASMTAIPANGIIATTLPNPSSATQVYTIRLYHATNDTCYTDMNVTLTQVNCTCPSGNCGTVNVLKN